MELVSETGRWQSLWLKAMLVIVRISLLYEFFQWRISKAVEIEKLRNRSAQYLHDELGATLSRVSIYGAAL